MNDDEIDGFLDGKRPRSTSDEDIDAWLGPDPKPTPVLDDFGREVAGSNPEQDHYIAHSSIGRVLYAFGQGAEQGWGAGKLGLDPQTEETLRKVGILPDVQKGQTGIVRSFNEAAIRPAAAALDAVSAAGSAASLSLRLPMRARASGRMALPSPPWPKSPGRAGLPTKRELALNRPGLKT